MTERGHGVADVAKRLGMSDKSLYLWVRVAKDQQGVGNSENASLKAEVSRLKAELKRANEERDIFKKKPPRTLPSCPGEGKCLWLSIKASSACAACAGCIAVAFTLGRPSQNQSALWPVNL